MSSRPDQRRDRARPATRRAAGIAGHALAAAVILPLAALVVLALMSVMQRQLTLPQGLTGGIETRVNAALVDASVEVGALILAVDRRGVPGIRAVDVALADGAGRKVARLDVVGADFSPRALLRGRAEPVSLSLAGAEIALQRDATGALDLTFGGAPPPAGGGLAQLLDGVEATLARPPFHRTRRITVTGLRGTMGDARSGRVWRMMGGDLTLDRAAGGLVVAIEASVADARAAGMPDAAVTRASATLRTAAADSGARLTVRITGAPAGDVALQAPSLAFLGVLDAPLSGTLSASLRADGTVGAVSGALHAEAGALRPGPGVDPVPFDSANLAFAFDPATARLRFDRLDIRAPAMTVAMDGHADLRNPAPGGWPRTLLAQMRLARLEVAAGDLFAGRLAIRAGQADLRIGLSPFEVTLGAAYVDTAAGDRLHLSGDAAATPEGWRIAADLRADRIEAAGLLSLWPTRVAPGLRRWLDGHLLAGTMTGLHGAVRQMPGEATRRVAASFDFDGAQIAVLRDMPPITGAGGYASVNDHGFALTLTRGSVTPDAGGPLDLAGSTMVVPDARVKPGRGRFDIAAQGSLTGLLSLLDRPPLELMAKAGRPPDLAEARVAVDGTLAMSFRRGLTPADLDYAFTADLLEATSDVIVPGRTLRADRLRATAGGDAVTVSGDVTVDGLPATVLWRQPLGPEARGGNRLTGQVELGPRFAQTFGIGLPDGMLDGAGQGAFTLDLGGGAPPRFTLASNLGGVGVRIPGLGWAKPRAARGSLDMAGRLGPDPRVDSFALSAAGLRATGSVGMADGALEAVRLDRLRLDDWLDAAVTLTGRGPGRAPAIAVRGGTVDVRRATIGAGTGGAGGGTGGGTGGGGGSRGPVTLALDRLVLTDTIALTNLRGQLGAGRGLNGTMQARVNGGAPVDGTFAAVPQGTALRLRATDAGAVLRDAGLVGRVRGGTMELVLSPTGAPGSYDGQLNVGRTSIRQTPVLAELLSAVSLVGLVELMNGEGIVFDAAEARFLISPGRLTLYRSSAVGGSMGLSLDGIYDFASGFMDMQGVLSPIYAVNRLGAIFTRAGEGLFGMAFTLRGPARDPAVSVNPLSLLTPGAFREIFRRPPPVPPPVSP